MNNLEHLRKMKPNNFLGKNIFLQLFNSYFASKYSMQEKELYVKKKRFKVI